MATTRIMPLHIGKGRTESQAISDIIDYVANPQKTDNGKLITGYGCDSRTADAEFLLAKRQYIAATGRVRGADDVIAYHVRQSFKPGEITPEEANRLGVEFLESLHDESCRCFPDREAAAKASSAWRLKSAAVTPYSVMDGQSDARGSTAYTCRRSKTGLPQLGS